MEPEPGPTPPQRTYDPYDHYDEPEPREPVRAERPRAREREPEFFDEPEPRRSREPRYSDRERGDRRQGPSADTIGRIIQVTTALISLMFVLHIVFVVAGANQQSGFVAFTYSVAKFFVFGLGDVFTPGDPTIGVVLNYGLASILYLVLGRIVARALKR